MNLFPLFRVFLSCVLVGSVVQGAPIIYVVGVGGNLLKSIDNGSTWQTIQVTGSTNLLQGSASVGAIVVDPKNPQVVYSTGNFGAASAFLSSTDGAATWKALPEVGFQFIGGAPGVLGIDSTMTNVLYSLAQTTTGVYLYRSVDFGGSWSPTYLPSTVSDPASNYPNGPEVTSFCVDPGTSGLIYAVAENYIFKSTDFGSTWNVLSSGVYAPIDPTTLIGGSPVLGQLTVDPHDSKTIYAAAPAGALPPCPERAGANCTLWKTSDGGLTWKNLNVAADHVSTVAFSTPAGSVYAGADLTGLGQTVVVSSDGGITWTPLKNGFSTLPTINTDPGSTSALFASDRYSFWRSMDGGSTWTSLALPSNCAGNPNCSQSTMIANVIVAGSVSALPSITSGGIVPVYGSSNTIQPGEWASIYGTGLANGTTVWKGDYPISLGGTSVTINGKSAYLSLVSPTQINFQAPADTTFGSVPVLVNTLNGSVSATVTLGQFAPSFLLLDSRHVAGIILRSNGSGAYGGGTYDIMGPTGSSLGYSTVAAKAGDSIELFATGFGPTSPVVVPGQAYSGAAATTNPVTLILGSATVAPSFAGLSGAGLDQINFILPAGLGAGDIKLGAVVGSVLSQSNVVIAVQ